MFRLFKMFIIMIIFFVFILLYGLYKVYNLYGLYGSITFYNKEETYRILKDNKYFYKNFTGKDLSVRGVKNIEEYMDNIRDDVCNFSFYDKIRISNCCRMADKKIYNRAKYNYFNGEKAVNIGWKFGCVNKYYENGFPHTIGGKFIILSRKLLDSETDNELVKTLIHEKIHLYQSKYKDDVKKYLDNNGIIYYKEREERDNIRVNPDTDNNIYKNKVFYYMAKFNDNSSTIGDVSYYNNNKIYEHPFEQMAYEISEEIMR